MENEIILSILSVCGATISGAIGFFTGKKKRDNEANKAAFEAYNYAIESLRKEFETRITYLQKENDQLRESNKELKTELKNIRNEIQKNIIVAK